MMPGGKFHPLQGEWVTEERGGSRRDRFYPGILPVPTVSDAENARYHNRDIEGLDPLSVWKEERRLEEALAKLGSDPFFWRDEYGNPVRAIDWILGRLARIRRVTRERERAA